MTNRICGFMLILLAIAIILIQLVLFPYEATDGTGSVLLLMIGVSAVIESYIHKNNKHERRSEQCLSMYTKRKRY